MFMSSFRSAYRCARPCLAVLLVGVLSAALAGCAPRPKEIPTGAQRRSSGNSGVVSWTTDQEGTVYVYDRSDKTLVYSGRVDPAKLVAVDLDQNQITVDGLPVKTNALH